MTSLGPVSAFLENELRTLVRQRGVVVWLDLDGSYTRFVDGLIQARQEGALPFAIHGFRGSHLGLMVELEAAANGVERPLLAIHLPGFNEESVARTPLLELYSAGQRFRKKLDTLITEAAAGRVPPEQIEAFRKQDDLSLEAADAWLQSCLESQVDGGLSGHLHAMKLTALLDDLVGDGFVAGRLRDPAALEAVWAALSARTGLSAAWRSQALPQGQPRPADLAFVLASWALAVEYVHDLKRPTVEPILAGLGALPRKLVEACQELAAHLRERHGSFYPRTADETEGWLGEEVKVARAEDLGKVDTFRFEEDRVLEAALQALHEESWAPARAWAESRLGRSYWVQQDPARRAAWQLIAQAVALGEAMEAAGAELRATTLEQAVERYASAGAAVDQAHRHLEQWRVALLFPQVPRYEVLRARLDVVRDLWQTWADLWAEDFNRLCQRQGFLPSSSQQQRALFNEVVRPLAQQEGPTAYFVVDALRYEMGEELYRAMADTPATTAHLKARLAELPTTTEVGMNVLAPVESGGRLRPEYDNVERADILGFSSGEFRVRDPESRKRVMWARVGGSTCPWLPLSEVLTRDSAQLRQTVSRARLVVVHSGEIDAAGESGAGLVAFDTIVQQLRAAWRLLREAGVRRFVFTADHGFLLLDDQARKPLKHGLKSDPKRRHRIVGVGADQLGVTRVPLADLGYDNSEGLHLLVPSTTRVFDTGNRPMSFVHGGNSLQERVIPVLTVIHRAATGSETLSYSVQAQARDGVANMHCLAGRLLVQSQGQLSFGGTREVELALRVVDEVQGTVELCQVRGGGRIAGGLILATVGDEFEVFFRLGAPREARVRVELFHPSAIVEVVPCTVDARFAVTPPERTALEVDPATTWGSSWFDGLEGNVRQVFEHLAAHGAVTEDEAQAMLGGPRALRRFSARFEEHAARAPFEIRIDQVGGVKRYVRVGRG